MYQRGLMPGRGPGGFVMYGLGYRSAYVCTGKCMLRGTAWPARPVWSQVAATLLSAVGWVAGDGA